jgi:hypothetical protein
MSTLFTMWTERDVVDVDVDIKVTRVYRLSPVFSFFRLKIMS